MKKMLFICLPALFVYALFSFSLSPAAGNGKDFQGKTVRISEKLFIAQTNDIYINARDYFGKTIIYEGLYKSFTEKKTGEVFHCVIRYGPGCCANDGEVGFEVKWDGQWPGQNDWCEVSGTLEEYKVNGMLFLRLNLSSLKVLEKRGKERVRM